MRRTPVVLGRTVAHIALVALARDAGAAAGGGRLCEVNGYRVLELSGSPEEMGEAHGRLLENDIRRVVKDVLSPDARPERWRRILAGTRLMEPYQPERFRREMRALASAAQVDYLRVVALQLFGDAECVAPYKGPPPPRITDFECTTYAVFGPATRTGECIIGRNFDYWHTDVARYASLIIYYRPEGRNAFVTLTWAGVINGWTLINNNGLVAANNSAYGGRESAEGVSTCFLSRAIVEGAATVEEGVAIARRGPRAISTVTLLAGGEPPDAVQLEFDHERMVIRRAHRGYVIASNGFRALGRAAPPGPDEDAWGRYGALLRLISENHGRIDRTMNFAAAPGVPLEGINLHSALLFPKDLTFAVSMGTVPACRGRFRRFRMTEGGIVSAEGER